MKRTLPKVCAALLAGALVLAAEAKTVAWYRFDDLAPGTTTVAGNTFANSAPDSDVPAATPHSQTDKTWGTDSDYMPDCVRPFNGGLGIYDPVSGLTYANRSSLKFKGAVASSVNPASAVSVPNDTLRLTSFTAECFVKTPKDIYKQTMSTILHMQRATGAATWTLQYYGNSGTTSGFFVRWTTSDGTVHCDYTRHKTDLAVDGRWHHVAITYDPRSEGETAVMTLWVDYENVKSWEFEGPKTFDYKDKQYFLIGSNTVQAGRNFPGEIDEVRLSDTALDASQFLRCAPLPGASADPDTVFYVSFDQTNDLGNVSSAVWTNGLNEIADSPYSGRIVTKGTATDETYRFSDAGHRATNVVSRGVFGPTNENLAAMMCFTNAPKKGQCLIMNDTTATLTTNDFTVECFVKFDHTILECEDTNQNMVPFGSASFRWTLDARKASYRQIAIRTFTNASSYVQMTIGSAWHTLDDGNWHHIAVVWNREAKTMLHYLDYVEQARHRVDTLTGLDEATTGGNIVFGARGADVAQPFSGWLDECRVTRRALKIHEFLTGRHCDGQVRAWLGFEGVSTAKPDPFGQGLNTRDQEKTAFVTRPHGKSVLDSKGSVLRTNTQCLSVNGGRVTLNRLTEIEEPAVTVEFQMKMTEIRANGNAVVGMTLSGCGEENARTWAVGGGETAGSLRLRLHTTDGEKSVAFPERNYADGRWHHIAFSVSGTDVKLYVDYACVQEATLDAPYHPEGVLNSTSLVVGSGDCTGLVDEVRIQEGVHGPEDFLYAPEQGLMLFVR